MRNKKFYQTYKQVDLKNLGSTIRTGNDLESTGKISIKKARTPNKSSQRIPRIP